jgi:hypothetical protein
VWLRRTCADNFGTFDLVQVEAWTLEDNWRSLYSAWHEPHCQQLAIDRQQSHVIEHGLIVGLKKE